jgi:L-aminopeptidase/D-esterase-like protein
MGEAAAAAAHDGPVVEGAVGAGTGATVGKILGMKQAMKSGIGSFTVELPGGVKVAALAAVNAVGDVRDSAGKIIAGARRSPDSMEFADGARALMSRTLPAARQNTTLVAVATNAALTKVEATKLAQFGSLGVARSINPVNMTSDGDLVIAMSIGSAKASLDALGVAAAEAVAESILRAVRMAPSLGGLPGLKK